MKKRMMSKSLFLIVIAILVCLFTGCRMTKKASLTVTGIHDIIIQNQTTTKELRQMYGEPYKLTQGEAEVEKIRQKVLDNEYSTDDYLDDQDYWGTIKKSSEDKRPKGAYQECYEYRGGELGVKAVYFLVIDKKVVSFMFDNEITNKEAAKKDYYLKEWVD